MPGTRVLIIDDEPSIADVVKAYLSREGFIVHVARDGPGGLEAARRVRPDLIVLDVMLPGMDGIEVLRHLRRESDTSGLMLTARAEEADKVIGLSVGADDYLTKPFSPRELVARVKAILRRGRGAPVEAVGKRPLVLPRLRMDPARRRVWKDGREVTLTALEFDLLYAMASYPGMVFTREQLIQKVWGYDFYGDERVVDAHVKEVRRKLEDDPADPWLIRTVRGVGYRIEDGSA
ncbi:MAG: response regulator transcription factor [Armatimonadetes bacterium]|nr:response regulator transcription factor [Armatimonadota bacterium]